jgi:hypothetical protein
MSEKSIKKREAKKMEKRSAGWCTAATASPSSEQVVVVLATRELSLGDFGSRLNN